MSNKSNKCTICGNEADYGLYCPECRKQRARDASQADRIRKRFLNVTGNQAIIEINISAGKLGLSYGQYVSIYDITT